MSSGPGREEWARSLESPGVESRGMRAGGGAVCGVFQEEGTPPNSRVSLGDSEPCLGLGEEGRQGEGWGCWRRLLRSCLWLLSCKLLNDENYAGSRCSVKGFLPDQVHVLYKMFRNMRSNLTSLKEKSDFPDGAWVASGRQIRFLLNEDFKCGTPRRGRDSGPFWGQQ